MGESMRRSQMTSALLALPITIGLTACGSSWTEMQTVTGPVINLRSADDGAWFLIDGYDTVFRCSGKTDSGCLVVKDGDIVTVQSGRYEDASNDIRDFVKSISFKEVKGSINQQGSN